VSQSQPLLPAAGDVRTAALLALADVPASVQQHLSPPLPPLQHPPQTPAEEAPAAQPAQQQSAPLLVSGSPVGQQVQVPPSDSSACMQPTAQQPPPPPPPLPQPQPPQPSAMLSLIPPAQDPGLQLAEQQGLPKPAQAAQQQQQQRQQRQQPAGTTPAGGSSGASSLTVRLHRTLSANSPEAGPMPAHFLLIGLAGRGHALPSLVHHCCSFNVTSLNHDQPSMTPPSCAGGQALAARVTGPGAGGGEGSSGSRIHACARRAAGRGARPRAACGLRQRRRHRTRAGDTLV
jgi:hypothetical protein